MDIIRSKSSYELITLLDKSKVYIKYKYKYLFIFIIKYNIYKIKTSIKIKKYNNKEKINLLLELFKEYVYLQNILHDHNISYLNKNSKYYFNISYGNLEGSVYYKDKNDKELCLRAKYNLSSKDYCLYLDTSKYKINTSGFNITEKNLDNSQKYELFYYFLNLFFNDILLIWIELYNFYLKGEN